MVKKIVVGILVITLIGGAAVALMDREAVAASQPASPVEASASLPDTQANAQPDVAQATPASGNGTPQSVSSVGNVWSTTGTILTLDTVGMALSVDGGEIYVELGSPQYWPSQGVTLNPGDTVAVDGFFNGTDYHARTVTTSTGQVLSLRDAAGRPLWAGSDSGSNGAASGQGQVPADEWVEIDAVVTGLTNSGVVIQTNEGQALTVSFGRADFWQTQAVTFAVGDAVSLRGFWQGTQFSAGQVTKTASGERILLRDPNGRPLWAGPGRTTGTGQGTGGQGNGGQGNGGQGTGGQGNGGQGNGGQGTGGQGNGGQGNGGQGTGGQGNGGQGNGGQGNGGQGNGGQGNGGRGNGGQGNGGRGNGGQGQYAATPTGSVNP
jgi:hypothetical protein